MARITKVTDGAGAVTYTEVESTLSNQLTDIFTLPLDVMKAAADDNEFISRKHASLVVIGAMLGGAELGDRYSLSVGRLINGMG